MWGFKDKDPVICFAKKYNLALFRKIEVTTDNLLSQLLSWHDGIWLLLSFAPLLKTVIAPVILLPALFGEKYLKNFFNLANLQLNITFLNLSVLVSGLSFFIKI